MLPYSCVDVFTDSLGLGNPVAVVHDADTLTPAQKQLFARWTNLSETTFLLTATDPAADYRLRIFTPSRELPFAGHPTVGSARAWLTAGGVPRADRLVQECGAGLVEVRREGDRLAFAAPPLLRGGPVEAEDVAAIAGQLGVGVEEVVDAQWCDNGPGWVTLLLESAERVLSLDPGPLTGPFPHVGVVGPHPAGPEVDLEVRAFTETWEDPVTGSLNAAIGQWLVPAGRVGASYVAAQGTALGRRGRVHVTTEAGRTWVGGDTVVGVRGEADPGTAPS
ncbi:phenazine biosynthesis protein PhzF [Marmoricola endophyticus]|uniref:Phenazine biosynthesis protein PhzF n=1 Tax=Marmoricola endophyticus TaxID=2040280 RepID=A0A917F3D6_9ACTN|nr:PhzF family phenazine biosynthesis protein [Marmoricola endophyticus]GGF45076.1 phenazine biosynthesis protein PhzF [Marmoricola endophyticus]